MTEKVEKGFALVAAKPYTAAASVNKGIVEVATKPTLARGLVFKAYVLVAMGYRYEPPAPVPGPLPGEDIWAAQTRAEDVAAYTMTGAGDWASVSGREAVQQSLIRRFLTKPGDYRVDPTYGAGLLAAVKKRMRRSDLDEIVRRLRYQALADERVRSVESVKVEALPGTANGLKYTITVRLAADGQPLTFSREVVG